MLQPVTVDRLSALFENFRVRAHLIHAGALCGLTRFPVEPGRAFLHVLRRGSLQVTHAPRSGAPRRLHLTEPTLLLYPRPLAHEFRNAPEADNDFTCASLYFDGGAANPLVRALPPLLALRIEAVEGIAPTLGLLYAETERVRCGQRLLADDDAPIEMRFAGNQAKFAFSGMEFVTKLVEGKFPDYNRVIPKAHKNHVTLGRAPLLASLQRAAILTSEKFKGVRLNIEPGLLRIASSNAEQEEAKEELEVDYGGDAIEIGFNVTYLMDALSNMSQDMVTVSLQDASSSALFTVPGQTGFKYVVMPMRI